MSKGKWQKTRSNMACASILIRNHPEIITRAQLVKHLMQYASISYASANHAVSEAMVNHPDKYARFRK